MTIDTQLVVNTKSRAYSYKGAMLGTTVLIIQLCVVCLGILAVVLGGQVSGSDVYDFNWGKITALIPDGWIMQKQYAGTLSDSPVMLIVYDMEGSYTGHGPWWWTYYWLPQDDSAIISIYVSGTSPALLYPGVTNPLQAAEQVVAPLNKTVIREIRKTQVKGAPAAVGSFFFSIPTVQNGLHPAQTQVMMYALIFSEDEAIEFRAICKPGSWITYKPIFEKVLKSIEFEYVTSQTPTP